MKIECNVTTPIAIVSGRDESVPNAQRPSHLYNGKPIFYMTPNECQNNNINNKWGKAIFCSKESKMFADEYGRAFSTVICINSRISNQNVTIKRMLINSEVLKTL
jgi:hypothetical protein